MKYLSSFESYIFESFEKEEPMSSSSYGPITKNATARSSAMNFRQFEKDAKKYNLDLEDENVQKTICDEIIRNIESSNNTLDLRVDLSKIAKPATPTAPVKKLNKNESKIFENLNTNDTKKSFSDLLEKLKKIDEVDLDEKTILDNIDSSTTSEETNKEEVKESVIDALKWLKENKFTKFALNAICGVLKIISYIPNFILRVVNSVLNWILRNVFRFSHETTSKVTTLFFPIVSMCVITMVFLPLISAGISIVSGISVITAFAGFSFVGVTSSGFKLRGLYRTFKALFSVWNLEPKEEIFTFLEYLDELEKISSKKIRINLDTRKAIEDLDKTIGLEYSRAEHFYVPEEISKFLKNDIEKVKLITSEQGFDKVKIQFPVFDKIIDNIKPTEEDFENLLGFFTKKDPKNSRQYRYYKTIPKFESNNLLNFKQLFQNK